MNRLRLLQILADGKPGGGTTVVLGLCADLAASGQWQVAVITQPDSYASSAAKQMGFQVAEFDFFTSRFDWRIAKRLTVLLDRIRPDLVHVHGGRAAFPFTVSPLDQLGIPLVYTVHGYHFRLKPWLFRWLGWLAEKRITRRFDYLTWVSCGDRAIARDWRLLPGKAGMAVTHNGIDTRDYADLPAPKKTYDLVFAGRMEVPKNPQFMIDLLDCMRTNSVSLLMIGGGSLEHRVRAYAEQKCLTHLITFTGSLTHAKTLEAINQARIAVLPSLWEGFPMLPLEAGYLGLPVIAANIRGVDEMILDGETGMLINGHSPQDFADAASRLLANPQLIQTMGIAASEHIGTNFSRQNQSAHFADIYRELLCSSGPSR